jgi:hypothetical protein
MTIRTVLNFGGWEVVKYFRCEICKEHFIMKRNMTSNFKLSMLFETECKAHAEFCNLVHKAQNLVERNHETQNKSI